MKIEIEVEPVGVTRKNGERYANAHVLLDGEDTHSEMYSRIRDARRGAKRLKKRLIEAAKKAEIVEVGR